MFKLLRFYSVASFFSILVAAAALTFFYRQVAVHGIAKLAEENNTTLARTALSSLRYGVVVYLSRMEDAEEGALADSVKLPILLATDINTLLRESSVVRIRIYNRKGVVVFSTVPSQIGRDDSGNRGFISAVKGNPISKLIYRDTFNSFNGNPEEDNLVQTYLPVQAGPADPILGVFEVCTDVNAVVADNERTLFTIMAGVGVILFLLYGILVLLVRYARGIIDQQQQTIRERTATLEVLSAQMLKSEEMEKKKMAFELHEGLAQTLSAIKVLLEGSRKQMGAEEAKSLEGIVPVLQDTIREVRDMATELRPSSLDDLGLLPALREFATRFGERYPDVTLEQEVTVEEQSIPSALKVVIYRIIESATHALAREESADRIRLTLRLAGRQVKLEIDEVPLEPSCSLPGSDDGELQLRFADMQERTILSGGIFSMERNGGGGITLRSTWEARPSFA